MIQLTLEFLYVNLNITLERRQQH